MSLVPSEGQKSMFHLINELRKEVERLQKENDELRQQLKKCNLQNVNNRYLIWRKQVVRLAVRGGIIRHSTKVTNDFMKPYFDDGYSPASALDEEYGKSWRPSYNCC